jgi:hypothetical protein
LENEGFNGGVLNCNNKKIVAPKRERLKLMYSIFFLAISGRLAIAIGFRRFVLMFWFSGSMSIRSNKTLKIKN